MTLRILAACVIAAPAFAQNVPQHIANDFLTLFGSHQGYRITHAKGLIVTGTFTPAPGATSLSRAPHLSAASTPVIVRFSDGTGIPDIPDNNPNASPRGIAIRFSFPNGTYTDIVANSHNGFVVGTGEDFAAFLDAVIAKKPEAFLATHPAAKKFVTDPKPMPTSFATEAWYGNDAFIFVNTSNAKQAGRYRVVPVGGTKYLDDAAAAKTPPNYLFDELPRRLAKGPIKLRVQVQLANPGDPTNDATKVWPDDRKVVELGVVTLTTVAPDNAALQKKLAFNPIYLADGIQLSDDPLVPLRSAVYALSVARRR